MKAKVGEKIRLFVGVGSHVAANFHIIGAVFDKLYKDGTFTNPPLKRCPDYYDFPWFRSYDLNSPQKYPVNICWLRSQLVTSI